ncbi:MAG: hypothetical protein WD605_01230 [Candidatus Paceibacterota bacterium]
MSFNHYAKIKRILENVKTDWHIRLIKEPTKAKNFKGDTIVFTHYYRIYDGQGKPIKYCKFQQIERLAKVLNLELKQLPVISDQLADNK